LSVLSLVLNNSLLPSLSSLHPTLCSHQVHALPSHCFQSTQAMTSCSPTHTQLMGKILRRHASGLLDSQQVGQLWHVVVGLDLVLRAQQRLLRGDA
jgi:hypothetical protein